MRDSECHKAVVSDSEVHKADEVSKVRLAGEIDDELDGVSEVNYDEVVRSERLMSEDELDEDCDVCQADDDELDQVGKVGESILQRERD